MAHCPVRLLLAWVVICVSTAALAQETGSRGEGVPEFKVRPGYRITLAAQNLQEARFLEFADNGILFVSQPRLGSILSLRDSDNDGVYETAATFISGKPSVQGMQFHDGWLYFTQSTTGSTIRARDTSGDGVADETEVVLPNGSVPAGGGHPYRAILISADSIYISVSDPRNMTADLDSDRKKIYRFDRDGKNRREFCSGIRNTEKLRFRPGTNEIWGCDHGSDNFGETFGETRGDQPITDLNPPEELNHYIEGGFYGHPYLMGNRVPRPEFQKRPDIIKLAGQTISPAWSFGAHWAPNGFCFLSTDYFPGHKGDLFIAFHGSWNRSEKSGYCIQRVLFDAVTGQPYGSLTIVSTLGPDGAVLARPVDCAEAPDGSIVFSCDTTHRIYRISRDGK